MGSMTRFLVSLFLLVLSAPTCTIAQESGGTDDAAILSTVVQSMCLGLATHGEKRYIVLSDRSEEIGRDGGKEGLNRDALASLVARNSLSHQLPKITLCSSVKVFKRDDIRAAENKFVSDDFLSDFRKAFPGSFGPTTLSLPGYAEGGTSALVVMSNAGGSFYYVLRRVDGKWRVDKSVFRSIA